MRAANEVIIRSIPLLTEAELESVRTPQDLIRIVAADPHREFVPLPNGEPAETRQPDSSGIRLITFGAICFTFGLSVVDCMILLTNTSGALAVISAVTFSVVGWWMVRSP